MSVPLVQAPFTTASGRLRHAAYAALAARTPVHHIALPNGQPAWLITGYDEARQALCDPRLVKSDQVSVNLGSELLEPQIFAAMSRHMLNRNPPDHTRLRRLVAAAFTQRRVQRLAPRIQYLTDELLDAIAPRTQVELISSFALPLPMKVICELLGVPAERRTEFHHWSSTVINSTLESPAVLVAASNAMVAYLRELVQAKRSEPTDDLLSALVAARDGRDRLTEDELTSSVFLILVAGHETTVHLIGNGVHALLTHPEQLELLRAQPHRLGAAIEELLRFDGPLQVSTFRVTSVPVSIGAITIPAGEIVLIGVLAANRASACAAQPQVLDIARTDTPHLSFGRGLHHCLGAPLARLEGRIAVGTLLTRFPRLRLAVPAEHLTWRPNVLINGLDTLPVILR